MHFPYAPNFLTIAADVRRWKMDTEQRHGKRASAFG
jgi:hypothetical protein